MASFKFLQSSPASTNIPSSPYWSPENKWSLLGDNNDAGQSFKSPLVSGGGDTMEKTTASGKIARRARSWRLPLMLLVIFAALGGISTVALFVLRDASTTSSPVIWDPALRVEYSTEPLAKTIIRQFDAYNMARGGRDDPVTFKANVERYMCPDMVYESVGFGNWKTPSGWAQGEEHNYGMTFPETIFTQMLFFGDQSVATTTTYGRALWSGDFLGVPASNTWVNLRITDFYHIRAENATWGRIEYNFMMIDWADLMRQVGRPLLSPAPLPEGLVLPPAANDGVPAPLSAVVQAEGRNASKANLTAAAALNEWVSQDAKSKSWHTNLTFYGPGGIGMAQGILAYEEYVLKPFHAAFVNRSVSTRLSACEGNYCAAFGNFTASGVASWLGLPTTGKTVSIRFGMHWRIVDDKVQEGWAIFDIPGLFSQLGLDFWDMASKAK
jgi:predicted ester cyclase